MTVSLTSFIRGRFRSHRKMISRRRSEGESPLGEEQTCEGKVASSRPDTFCLDELLHF
jgi:hypothetical protein